MFEEVGTLIVIDTVSPNLGTVVNTNSEIKEFLGYDKNYMIGKNVTRLMPKVYSKLHDNFILNYLKRETVKK